MEKTNALRLLDQRKVSYQTHGYESDGLAKDAIEVARLIGQPVTKVYKTLIVQAASKRHYVFVIEGDLSLDLKKAAAFIQEKSIALVEVKELLDVTGYVRGGCSPVGLKKPFPVIIDHKAKALDRIIVSAGKLGLQMELKVEDLIQVTRAKLADVTMHI